MRPAEVVEVRFLARRPDRDAGGETIDIGGEQEAGGRDLPRQDGDKVLGPRAPAEGPEGERGLRRPLDPETVPILVEVEAAAGREVTFGEVERPLPGSGPGWLRPRPMPWTAPDAGCSTT